MKRIVLSLTLAACALVATGAAAQTDLGLKGIGASVGYVSPEDIDGTFGFGVLADCGTITPRIGLETRLDYWSKSEDAFGTEASVRDIILGARGKYFFEVANPRVRPFAGAGLGLHFLKSEVTIPAMFGFPAETYEDSETKLGLDIGGGIGTPVGPKTELTGEAWYGIVSDVSQFSLRVALNYRLGM
jgi:opacity protein-like surface antigen